MQTLIENYEKFIGESEINLIRTGGGVKGIIQSEKIFMHVISSTDEEGETKEFDLTKIDTSVIKSLVQKSIRRGDYEGIMFAFLLAYSFVADAAKNGKIETMHRSWMTNFTNRIIIALPEDIGLAGIQVFPLVGQLLEEFNGIRFDYSKLDKMIEIFSKIARILSDPNLKRIRQISFLRAFYYTNSADRIKSFTQTGSEQEVDELLEFRRDMELLDGFKFYFKKGDYACFFYLMSILNEKKNSGEIKELIEFIEKNTNWNSSASKYLKNWFKNIKNKDGWIFLAQLVIIGLDEEHVKKLETDWKNKKDSSNGNEQEEEFKKFVEFDWNKIYFKKYVFDMHTKGYKVFRNGTNEYFAKVSSLVSNEDEDVINPHWKNVYIKMKLAKDSEEFIKESKKRKREEKVEKNKKK